ncbi:putative holin-like toxin [Lactococcus petauri]
MSVYEALSLMLAFCNAGVDIE